MLGILFFTYKYSRLFRLENTLLGRNAMEFEDIYLWKYMYIIFKTKVIKLIFDSFYSF